MRIFGSGTRTYHSASYTGHSVAAIHDHANNRRTVGMGEFVAVLNGVEFRTRHNDYALRRPSTTSTNYNEVEDIPFPDVPSAVTDLESVEDQMAEMREWFKAWRDQDYSVRNYRDYFKPVLCYLEGAWTNSEKLEESFLSDRHFLDAISWFDMQEKVRYTSYTGAKSNLENFSYLPTTIMNMINGTIPHIAQWNYRILCHPLGRDLPLNRFRVVDDLTTRIRHKRTLKEHAQTRAARFTVNPHDTDRWVDKHSQYGILDELMSEIPGKDNYGAVLNDSSFNIVTLPHDTSIQTPLNTANFHRVYRVEGKGAMGRTTRRRGFSDDGVFMAMNTRSNVAGIKLKVCKSWNHKICQSYSQKWSYAIPLEIVYMTPLLKWNPYGIVYKGEQSSDLGKTVFADGRRGSTREAEFAFNGSNSKKYYQTPIDFFSSGEKNQSPADTVKGSAGVLDPEGVVRIVAASGTRIILPDIEGVGSLRTRYPIMPVHSEGSAVSKELEALKDILLNPAKFSKMLNEEIDEEPGQK